jgi:MFS family permease
VIRSLFDTYRDAFAGLPRAVWLISLAQFVNRSGMMVFPFLALWLTKEREFSTAQAANALALYGAGAIAGALLGGELVDRVGARRVMLASFLLSGVGWLVLGMLRSHALIFAMIVVQSVLVESLRPATSSALAHCAAPGERVRAYALHRLAINLGMSFGPTIGGFVAVHSYGALFVTNGCTCLAAGATLWFLFRNEPGLTAPARTEDQPVSRSPWRDGPFLVFLALMATLAMVFLQINSTFSLYVNGDLGHSEARIGLLLGLNTVLIVLLEMVVVHKLRGVSPVKLLGPGAFLLCAGFALMPFDTSFAWLAFTVVIWTIGEMLALPLVESIVADRADERSRGRYMGLFTMSFGVSLVVAPVIGMWVYERLGPDPLWFSCGALGVALWIGFELLGSRLKRIEPARVAATTRP